VHFHVLLNDSKNNKTFSDCNAARSHNYPCHSTAMHTAVASCGSNNSIDIDSRSNPQSTPLLPWRPGPGQTESAGQISSADVSRALYLASTWPHSVNKHQQR